MPLSKEFQKKKQGKERFFSAELHQFATGEAKATRRSQLLSLLATGKGWGTFTSRPTPKALPSKELALSKQSFPG